MQHAVFPRNVQLVLLRVKDLDAVLRAFGEGRAMPGIFVRAGGSPRRLPAPARHFELGLARPQARIDQPVFDVLHLRSPMRLRHAGLPREIGAAAKSSISPFARSGKTPQKGEESDL